MLRIDFNEIDSTNNEIKRTFLNSTSFPIIVTARSQLKGRGRNNRDWVSPAGKGLYLSYGNYSESKKDISARLMMISALSALEAISYHMESKDIFIKWPNDILIDNKKVCGILNEGIFVKDRIFFIIGTGINIKEHTYSHEEHLKAYSSTYLESYSKGPVSIKEVACSLVKSLIRHEKHADMDYLISTYRKYLYRPPQEVRITRPFDRDPVFGRILDIDSKGNLIVRSENKNLVMTSAEITNIQHLF